MKAIVLSEEQCTWSLEGETFLCLLYCFKTWQFQTTNECHKQHLYYLCTMQIFNVANWRGFFPEISLCCFPPLLQAHLLAATFRPQSSFGFVPMTIKQVCRFFTPVFIYRCENRVRFCRVRAWDFTFYTYWTQIVITELFPNYEQIMVS